MIFVRELPLYAWLATSSQALFGGMSIYYMGFYAFGSSVSSIEERAARLTRYYRVERGETDFLPIYVVQ